MPTTDAKSQTSLRKRRMVPHDSRRDNLEVTGKRESRQTTQMESSHESNGRTRSVQIEPDHDSDGFQETSLTQPLLDSSSEEEITSPTAASNLRQPPMLEEQDEASWQIGLQIFFPYIIAGFGMVGAGMVLDHVQVS